jgi:murein DD-endopeptidase MepM/ murein hydrolase activator NlpD
MRVRVLFLGLVFVVFFGTAVFAQEAEEIKAKISDQEQKIIELEQEIATYEKELVVIDSEKRTLESAVRELDISRQKVSANINLEERKINALGREITALDDDIGDTEIKIEEFRTALSGLLAQMHAVEEQSLVESFLSAGSIGDVWGDLDIVSQIHESVQNEVGKLRSERTVLKESRETSTEKRAERAAHQNTLISQRRAVDITKREKNDLLTVTNKKESSYQDLLEEKMAAKAEFEASLRELESALTYTLDPTQIPAAGKGVLAWPLKNIFITQQFGKTADSGRLYASGTHNGVDFRASIGTPVLATLSGTVVATGNTDGGGCYSYGKWILIRHNNGLSTLYAHLSNIMVTQGQAVSTRDIVGLSGYTGYATGPHLHMSLFITDGVQTKNLGDWYRENGRKATTACAKKGITIPIAAKNAYLDPMEYL